MISLYRTVITVETYVLANRPEDAAHTIARAYPEGKSITHVVDARAELVADVRDDAKAKRPNLGCYVVNNDLPAERGEWTCAQWAAALRDDLATEATRLRGEAGAAEKRAAELRAKAAELETLARPSAPAARDPALDGDAKTTTGPREDFAPLHPDMFGGTDFPEAKP